MKVRCINCGQLKTVGCTLEQWQQWRRGTLIQQAMPDVSKEQRELLLSGICGECWNKIFKPEQDQTTTKGH